MTSDGGAWRPFLFALALTIAGFVLGYMLPLSKPDSKPGQDDPAERAELKREILRLNADIQQLQKERAELDNQRQRAPMSPAPPAPPTPSDLKNSRSDSQSTEGPAIAKKDPGQSDPDFFAQKSEKLVRHLPYVAMRSYRDYRPYRAYAPANKPGSKKDCHQFWNASICQGTYAACEKDPEQHECRGTELHCRHDPKDRHCRGTHVYCTRRSDPTCDGTPLFCAEQPNHLLCRGTKPHCERDPNRRECYGTEAYCKQTSDPFICQAD